MEELQECYEDGVITGLAAKRRECPKRSNLNSMQRRAWLAGYDEALTKLFFLRKDLLSFKYAPHTKKDGARRSPR